MSRSLVRDTSNQTAQLQLFYQITMASTPNMDSDRPLSVRELTDLGLQYDFLPQLPLNRWYRAAEVVYREVS